MTPTKPHLEALGRACGLPWIEEEKPAGERRVWIVAAYPSDPRKSRGRFLHWDRALVQNADHALAKSMLASALNCRIAARAVTAMRPAEGELIPANEGRG